MKKLSLLFAALLTATVMNLSAATAGKAPDMRDFLYFTSLKADGTGTVRLNKYADVAQYLPNLTATFEYSTDRINWTPYDTWATDTCPKNTYQGNPIALAKGDTVFFRALGAKKDGKNATMSFNTNAFFKFAFGTNDSIAAGGNIMSLYDATCAQDSMTAFGFYYLFLKATQLVSAPKLPAKKMTESCYAHMFQSCTSLTTAPALPATTLFKSCYMTMFSYCSSLTQAPELPLTTLAESCYSSMFNGCTSLTTAPALPATTLTPRCYMNMFKGCTALTQAPELKATTLANQCYSTMFQGCTSLQVDTCADDKTCTGALLVAPSTGAPYWNNNMFKDCKGNVTTPQLGGHYCMKGYKDMHDFLYFVGLNGNDTVRLNKFASNYLANLTATFEYSKDRINWDNVTWATDTCPKNTYQGNPIALAEGDTVFFRAKGTNGKNATVAFNNWAFFKFAFGADDQIAAGGNIMSLYDAECKQDTMTEYGFFKLFLDAKQLVSAPKLPATKLATNCYNNMFTSCTALTKAPELKAETLVGQCYNAMFKGCTALTKAPELKATTLQNNCYMNMFLNCTALTQAPELKATTLAKQCYLSMFSGCTSLQVDTCADGSCDGIKFEPTTTGTEPTTWSKDMFKGCKGGYTNVKLGGHYCIKEYKEPVCQIGTKGYESIAAAVAEVKAGDTIQVIKDIQLDAVIMVSYSTPAFTLDLNGHILDGSTITGNYAALIRNTGTLSIIDSNPTATHEAPFDTIQGAIMTGGKGMWVFSTITCGGAINNNYGALNVTGVTFVNNTAYYGGVVFAEGGTVALTNCRFYGESSEPAYMGSAIYLQKSSQCTIDSCIIKDYSAQYSTIYNSYQASLTIAHTTITNNSATKSVGGVYVKGAVLTLNDGTVITNNTSVDAYLSGGVYAWTDATYKNSISLSGKVIIKDNTSNGEPANLCLSGDPVCDTLALNGLSAGSEIYVCTLDANDKPAPSTFAANATEADMQYLKSDNGYAFVLKEGMIASKQAYGRKVTKGNFGTICLTKQFIAMEGVDGLFVPYEKTATMLYCEEVELKDVVAGGAYIFKSNADSVTFFMEGEAVTEPANNDHMRGWLKADFVLTGETDSYMLNNNQIIKPEIGSTILKNRAFIDLEDVPNKAAAPARGRTISFGINGTNTPTGLMQNAQCTMQSGKMMVNGQLIIIRDGKMFNAQGQEL